MNKQILFDFVVSSVIKQGVPSCVKIGEKVKTMYRSPYGHKCAVGFLIPNDKYDPECEGHGVGWLIDHGMIEIASHEDEKLLGWLMAAHDASARSAGDFISLFKADAKETADNFNLEWRF